MEAEASPQTAESAKGEETEDTMELWRHRMKSLRDLENFDEVWTKNN